MSTQNVNVARFARNVECDCFFFIFKHRAVVVVFRMTTINTSLNETIFIFADFHLLKREIRSRLWFSYRKDFPAIGDSGMTSDRGWGCMLRCGQMVVAESLQR